RARSVHDADHDGVGLLAGLDFDVTVAQVVLMEREAARLPRLHRIGRLGAGFLDARKLPHHALLGGAPLVEPDADSDVAIALALARALGLDLAQRAPFEIGQLQVLEHDFDQLLERDVGLVIIDAGAVAGLVVALAGAALADFADHLAGARVAVALADAGGVLAEDKAVFLDPAQRDLDYAVAVFADDRFLGDDVGDIFADRFADFLPMAQAVAGGTIGALGIGGAILAKDRLGGGHQISSAPLLIATTIYSDATLFAITKLFTSP